MYFIPQQAFKQLPILFKADRLTSAITAADLPQAYLDLLAEQNGGYLLCSRIPTHEPTSDGIDYAAVHAILGLHDGPENSLYAGQTVAHSAGLPDYFVPFSINGNQLFAFDYSKLSPSGEPSIRHIDIETDNWQTVAADFNEFLRSLIPAPIAIPEEVRLTHTEGAHAFWLADCAGLPELFLHFEDDPDKQWYLRWIAHFSNHPDADCRKTACEALETQILYFRSELPDIAHAVLAKFLADPDPAIRELALTLKKELTDG
ncbi:SMI1/KNR4 family protein [Trichococcus ilyis]|uniref:Armadillo-type fold n=1 Tax=Trichococcus ilyis TaxID=640938 RepID=A0A143YGQ0_9LACT|nr:SMI1/KNR4 family protein [Trichococcus ilyis]CZQ88851.1 armadillo-type fold [Trichococcus ilyis]SEI86641.1 SMI1 / KNR4 family (SUKH-1) [Trichococcus ilyis]